MALESKIAIWTPAIGDVGTFINKSTEASSSMGVVNLQNYQATKRWRSLDYSTGAPAFFEMDFGTDYAVDTVLMLYTNATNAAEIRVNMAADPDDLESLPDFTTGWVSHWPEWDDDGTPTQVSIAGWERTHALVNFASQTKRYLRVDVRDSTNPDGYYEAGRLYVSQIYQPPLNIAYGSGLPWPVEEVARLKSVGGGKHTIAKPIELQATCVLQSHYLDEIMEELYELARLRGTSKDFVYCQDPTSKWLHHFIVYGAMKTPTRAAIPDWNYYTVGFDMEELP